MVMKCNTGYLSDFVGAHEWKGIAPQIDAAHKMLHEKSGMGNDFLGWLDLPVDYDKEEFARIQKAAEKIKNDSKVLVVIGIGGSYLGARAVIEQLRSPLYNMKSKDTPDVLFVGNSIHPTLLCDIIEICKERDFSVNVISKSGTTTEPALAFRIFRELLEEKYGEKEAAGRIYATTDKNVGTLKELADRLGYERFVVPDDVGGRFSVLTAVGLLPIAVAGIDILALMQGAAQAREDFMQPDLEKNPCYQYAAVRNILHRKGKAMEIFVTYDPNFALMNEWLKQLFGESEGKDGKGLYPSSVVFSTDLHSLGQFIQEGSRIMFETVIRAKKPQRDFFIKEEAQNFDGLNFLANQGMSVVNDKAFEGTVLAHTEGGVPNVILELDEMNEFNLGYLIFFFEKACAISAYVLGVNPFDQPGVESYKNNMFALLGKPGYEDKKAALEQKLK